MIRPSRPWFCLESFDHSALVTWGWLDWCVCECNECNGCTCLLKAHLWMPEHQVKDLVDCWIEFGACVFWNHSSMVVGFVFRHLVGRSVVLLPNGPMMVGVLKPTICVKRNCVMDRINHTAVLSLSLSVSSSIISHRWSKECSNWTTGQRREISVSLHQWTVSTAALRLGN